MSKLNVHLAVTDQLRHSYKNNINDYKKHFEKSQGAYKGHKKTYVAKEGTVDDPKKRGIVPVATTVDEKIQYFMNNSKKFINALFSQEKTNSSGVAKAELVVDGKVWGEFTSLELLRLRSLLESSDLGNIASMIASIPVRSDSEVWEPTDEEEYKDRHIYESPRITGVTKTTYKKPRILPDPNLQGKELPTNYQAPIVQVDEVLELGDYTTQNFSGEWSHRDRANVLRRKDTLITAITEALKKANEVEAIESDLDADKIFGYLFYNK